MTDSKEEEADPPLDAGVRMALLPPEDTTPSTSSQKNSIVRDEKSDKNRVEVLCQDNVFRNFLWPHVQVGHICRIQTRDSSPADLIVLASSSEGGECYITTECFNKSKQFRLRKTIPIPVYSTLGIGDGPNERLLEELNNLIHFRCASSQTKDVTKFHASLVTNNGEEKLNEDHFVPRHANLMLTDFVIGLVMYTGEKTKFAVNGGWEGAEEQEKKDKEKKEKEKAKRKLEREQKEEERKKAMKSPEARIKILEESTGVFWEKSFTNVEDDGNCLMHAFWLGLKTLFKYYPKNKSPDEMELPSNPEDFRTQFFETLADDSTYRLQIKNFLQFLVEGIEESYLICMEDFYVLPQFMRDKILTTKQRIYQNEIVPGTLDFEKEFVGEFIEALRGAKIINGRKIFVPLGATELNALSRIYSVRLQIMSSNEVLKCVSAVTIDEVDPRTIPREAIQEFNSSQTGRTIRLLNVRANHYQVHLPRNETGEEMDESEVSAEFNSFNFWKPPIRADLDNLPPL